MKTPSLARLLSLSTCLLLIASGGCAKKSGRGAGAGADGDYVSGSALPDRKEGTSYLGSNVDRNQFPAVYFGFDSVTISGAEREKVERMAGSLKGMGNSVILAGFTDERGTPEYNRSLGERRALAVREALIQAGVDGSRLQTVSFGAEMPADPGSGEAAWAKNRRTEIGVVR